VVTAASSDRRLAMHPAELQRAFYDLLVQSQYWSSQQLIDYQRGQLEQLLRHARKNVPFYERRLDPVFRPNGNIDWSGWSRLPTVRRADMVAHREAMQARILPPGHGPTSVLRTSGSTGLPISVTVNNLVGIANNGLRWRLHGWQGLDWSKVLVSRLGKPAEMKVLEGERSTRWGPGWDGRATGAFWRISREIDTASMLQLYQRYGGTYLNAGPNMAHINALDAERLGIETHIEAVLVQGNVVRPADRVAVKRVFGAKMIEHYSSKEGGQMAHPCEHGVLHTNGETCLVEVIDETGQPCRPGETGRVVITPFVQTAQPLIRYEQGDWATVGGACACGRHSLTLATIVGRNVAIFRHPDGRTAASLMPEGVTELLRAHYWQLAQVGPNAYELRYVPVAGAPAADEASVRTMFLARYFDDAELAFVRLDRIALTAGGKLAEYINEWQSLN